MPSPKALQGSLEQHAAKAQRWALQMAAWVMLRWDQLQQGSTGAWGSLGFR